MASDAKQGSDETLAPVDEAPAPVAPSIPQFSRPKPAKPGGSPNPIAVIAAALAAGYVLAKTIDWRGQAHPRR